MKHGNYADRKITGDSAADLEESHRSLRRGFGVPAGEFDHMFDPTFHRMDVLDLPHNAVTREYIAECGVFPAGNKYWQILLSRSEQPGIFWIDLIMLFKF